MNKILMRSVLLLLVLSGAAVVDRAEQGFGVQADFVGQGLTYRALSSGGIGGEIIIRGVARRDDYDSLTYSVGGELRFIKLFRFDPTKRLYIGAAGGVWQKKEPYEGDTTRPVLEAIPTMEGLSLAGVVGFDWIIVEVGEGDGFALVTEVQVGYYNWPPKEWLPEETPRFFVLPGVGIGLRYIW
jgi:hypothetical protein